VANLIAQLAFGLLAMTISIPSMQEWAGIFGAPQSQVQLTFSAYVVTYGGLQLLWGPLSDRMGRRRILLVGLTLAILGSVGSALATGLPGLIAARALQGAGTAAGMVVSRAMVQDLFTGPDRTRVMAWVGMAMGLCPPLATIVGGQLHVQLGWASNFWLITVIGAGLWLAAWRGLPQRTGTSSAHNASAGAMVRAYGQLARTPGFMPFVAILAMTTATFYAFLAGAPLVLGDYGVGPDGIGFHIMAIPLSYIVGNFATSRLVHAHGDRRMMTLGQALTMAGIGLSLALALLRLDTPLAFTLPLILLGLGHGMLVPPTLAGTVGVVPALAGAAAAVAGLAQQVTGAFGGWTVGLFAHTDAVTLTALMMAFAAMATVMMTVLLRQR
jgi:DHA1 family bicyclomycin/chloramphenicol resistance-like MFS transporter